MSVVLRRESRLQVELVVRIRSLKIENLCISLKMCGLSPNKLVLRYKTHLRISERFNLVLQCQKKVEFGFS